MRHIIVFPIKAHSERVPNKNFLEVGGRKLYRIMPSKAIASGAFDKVIIDTDSPEITTWAKSNNIETLSRLEGLASNDANGNDLIRHHRELYGDQCDFLWQGFVTAPHISTSSIVDMKVSIEFSQVYDSIFTVQAVKGFFWNSAGIPLTYRTDVLPRGQDIPPIYKEISGLFGIKVSSIDKTGSRIGISPRMYRLPDKEALDIDWPSDLMSAK